MRVPLVTEQIMRLPLWAIGQPLPGRPSLPGTDIPGIPAPMPGQPTLPGTGMPDTPYQPPQVPGMPGRPDTGETVPRPNMPDTNIPDTGPTVPRPDLPDPGVPTSPGDGGSVVPQRDPNDDFPVVTPVPAPA